MNWQRLTLFHSTVCYKIEFSNKCEHCYQPIAAGVKASKSMGKQYHAECFKVGTNVCCFIVPAFELMQANCFRLPVCQMRGGFGKPTPLCPRRKECVRRLLLTQERRMRDLHFAFTFRVVWIMLGK